MVFKEKGTKHCNNHTGWNLNMPLWDNVVGHIGTRMLCPTGLCVSAGAHTHCRREVGCCMFCPVDMAVCV